MSSFPLTSSVAAGVTVPMPMSVLFWNITESTMSLAVSHMGMWSTTPFPVTFGFDGGAEFLDTEVEDALAAETESDLPELAPPAVGRADDALASAKSEAGRPPSVWASPAFSAYGTLTSRTRACSGCRSIWIPSQRASPLANNPMGTPVEVSAPSRTV